MDDLERRIVAQLVAVDPEDQPAPWLGTRILAGVRRRRRWRALAAAVAAIAASTVVLPAEPAPPGPPPAELPSPGPITRLPVRQVSLRDLVDLDTAIRVSSLLPDGSHLDVMALDADGTLVGARKATPAALPEDVWLAGPTVGAPVRVQDTPPDPYLWTMATDGGAHVWPDGESLKCAERGDPGRTRVLDRGWGGRTAFYAGGGAIVWTPPNAVRLNVAEACLGRIRTLPVAGVLAAFAYPHAFLRDDEGVRQVDVRSGVTQRVPGGPPLSTSPSDTTTTTLAANADLVAWGQAATITTLDRVTGARQQSTVDPPHAGDLMYFADLTAGSRLLASSMRHQDYDVGYAVVVDPRTGRTAAAPGRAWAAGDWLAWRDGDDYWVACTCRGARRELGRYLDRVRELLAHRRCDPVDLARGEQVQHGAP